MSETTPKTRFLESLERCSSKEGFVHAFYERFLSSSDEIRIKFLFTNFEKQEKMLLRSLQLTAGATSGDPAALREMRERAETHDRNHLNIKPHLYPLWKEALITSAQEFDPHWDEAIELAWNDILGFVIKHMVRSY